MTTSGNGFELTPEASAEERAELRELSARLAADRPAPRAGFRGSLRRRLVERDPGYGPRPRHLRAIVGAYVAAGAVLMALGAVGATGVGPLGG